MSAREGWILLFAWAIDRFYGEYPVRLHPVVWMGSLISFLQKPWLGRGRWLEYGAGVLLLLSVAGSFGLMAALSLRLTAEWPWLSAALAVFWLKSSFALRALGEAALQVKEQLESGALEGAQFDLRSLCSRDGKSLDARQVAEASISSLAENLSDSVIAPLFYYLIGGVPAAVIYRAVNTLDAMVGYKNHYRYLGWASARCDDLLNWIPARLTTLLLFLAGTFLRRMNRDALRIAWIDHKKTPSPNGGWPMAAMAGLLKIQLRKPGVYALGQPTRLSDPQAIESAWQLTKLAAWLGLWLSLLRYLIAPLAEAGSPL